MTSIPHPSVLQRYMDDQALLALRAPCESIARMHEAIAALYREQIVAQIRDLRTPL